MEKLDNSYFQAAKSYAKAHPGFIRGLQVAGVTVSLLSFCAVPALGALGFAATGPVAGSAAGVWQASIGIVEAGSLFSWCQSLSMGGAALGSIQAAGVAGAATAALASVGDISELVSTFKKGFRKP